MITNLIDLNNKMYISDAWKYLGAKFKRIGGGISAEVYDIQDNKILKITEEIVLYPFYKFLMNNPHPNLPVVYDIKKYDNFLVIISKKYEHIILQEDIAQEQTYEIFDDHLSSHIKKMYEQDHFTQDIKNDALEKVSKSFNRKVSLLLKNFIKEYFDPIHEAMRSLKNIKDIDWRWDLHYYNFMMDGNTIILNDPFTE